MFFFLFAIVSADEYIILFGPNSIATNLMSKSFTKYISRTFTIIPIACNGNYDEIASTHIVQDVGKYTVEMINNLPANSSVYLIGWSSGGYYAIYTYYLLTNNLKNNVTLDKVIITGITPTHDKIHNIFTYVSSLIISVFKYFGNTKNIIDDTSYMIYPDFFTFEESQKFCCSIGLCKKEIIKKNNMHLTTIKIVKQTSKVLWFVNGNQVLDYLVNYHQYFKQLCNNKYIEIPNISHGASHTDHRLFVDIILKIILNQPNLYNSFLNQDEK